MTNVSSADIVVSFGFFIFFTWISVLSQSTSDGCRTPDNRNGDCISIRNCQPLLDLLQKERPPTLSTINFLRQSQCGFEGRNPLVCCPVPEVYPDMESEPPTLPEAEIPDRNACPTDVSDHPAVQTLLPNNCGPVTEDKITRGEEAELYEFPWMALIGYNTRSGLQYRCGGSLINRRYVLTAAHCVANLNDLQLSEVRLGEHDLRTERDCPPKLTACAPPVQDFGIEEAIPHPDYFKPELRNDIALIRLDADAEMTISVQPICLPVGKELQEKTLENEKVTVTGWGATEFGTNSQVLLKVDLPIVPIKKCAQIYNRSVPVTEKQLCAGGVEGKDSCSGDSGGPLQFVGQSSTDGMGGLSYIQYGLVSFGPRHCGTQERPGVYTRIGYYMDWILSTMRP